MSTEAQKRAKDKYRAEKVKRFTIDFYPADIELWEHLQSQEVKQAYIKELIKKDMKKENSKFLYF